nr:adhesion G protein-coupled receptor E2-like [Chrysemys picta bellii]
MGTRGDVYPLGLCIALCLGGTMAQNNGTQGTTENCNSHMQCPANAKCVNNTHCTCLDGYQSHGNRFFTNPTEICDDINECLGPSPADCGFNTHCANVAGSYYCTCSDGYEPSSGKAKFMNTSENTCQDIDECRQNATICEPHGNCINMPGSYMCKCSWGFGKSQKDPSQICTDIEECRKTPDICGPKVMCINTYGSYWCECRAGYIPSNRNTTLCEGLGPVLQNLLGSFQAQMGRLCKAALEELKQMNSQNAKGKLQGFLDILEKKINLVGQQSESVEWRHRIATELMATVEKLLRTLGLTLPDSVISITSTNGIELGLVVRQAGNQSQETVTLQQSKTQMELNWTGAPGQENEGFTLAGLLTYQGMSPLLDGAGRVEAPEWDEIGQTGKRAQEPGRPSYRVLSPVVSAFISDPNPQALGLSISIRFSHPVPESKTDLRLLCAYWEPDSRRWASHGCTLQKLNATITHCQCNHLTIFAVLMAFYELEKSDPLTIIRYVGLTLSLLCLLLAILTFLLCCSIRNVSTSLHLQLCLCLFLADLLFLTPVTRTGSKVACAVIAGLVHYLFLACFSWMLLEGLHLFLTVRNLKVVNYTSASWFKKRFMYPFGYGFPALVVAISAAVNPDGYGTSTRCWLSLERVFLWSFLGPVCAIILINITFFALTLWILRKTLSSLNADMSTLRDHRLLTFKAIAQFFILGFTWIPGLFQVSPAATVMAYLFTVNSLQGPFIFLVHCLLNRQVMPTAHQRPAPSPASRWPSLIFSELVT